MDDQAHRDELKTLKAMLKEAEGNVLVAATYGKTLLEENMALKRQLASMKKQQDADGEGAAQEFHNLRFKLEMLQCEAASQKEDAEALAKTCRTLEQAKEAEAAQRQRLAQENAALEMEVQSLGERALRAEGEKDLVERLNSEMEMQLQLARQASESQVAVDQDESHLKDEILRLSTAVSSLKQDLAQQAEASDLLSDRCSRLEWLESRVTELAQELEAKECEAAGYANALERCRQEVADLRVEMSAERAPDTDLDRRGNSLFGEVEDRRQMLERQSAHMRNKYAVMKSENAENKATIHYLQLRIAALERNISHRVDASYAERLEDDLAAAHREIDALRSRVHCYTAVVEAPEEPATPAQGGSEYGFLSVMLEQEKQRVARQEEEKKAVYYKYVLARDEAQELRRKLYHKEKVYGGVEAENLRLRAEKQAWADKRRGSSFEDSPEKVAEGHQAELQTDRPGAGPLGEVTKVRTASGGGKENAAMARSGAPTSVMIKRNDCKQQ